MGFAMDDGRDRASEDEEVFADLSEARLTRAMLIAAALLVPAAIAVLVLILLNLL